VPEHAIHVDDHGADITERFHRLYLFTARGADVFLNFRSSWSAVLLQFGIAESLIVQVKDQGRLLNSRSDSRSKSLAQVSGACPACLWPRNKPKKYGQR
jgi:hypothetical protein